MLSEHVMALHSGKKKCNETQTHYTCALEPSIYFVLFSSVGGLVKSKAASVLV